MDNSGYQNVSILLVDDDDVDVMGVQRAFRKFNLTNSIIRAFDGKEALQLLRNGTVKRPYLLLLDLNMPRMNGLEMLQELRNDPELSDSIVFVLTTSNDQADKLKAYQNHIAGYIVKSTLDSGFCSLIQLLDHYWHLVEMPMGHRDG